jgi:hypothetical protein
MMTVTNESLTNQPIGIQEPESDRPTRNKGQWMLHDPKQYLDLWRQFRKHMASAADFRIWISDTKLTPKDWHEESDDGFYSLFYQIFDDDVACVGMIGGATPWQRMVFVSLDEEHNEPTFFAEFEAVAKLAGAFLPTSTYNCLDSSFEFGRDPFNDWLNLMFFCVCPDEAQRLLSHPTEYEEIDLTWRPFFDSARTIESLKLTEENPRFSWMIDPPPESKKSKVRGTKGGSKTARRRGRPKTNIARDKAILALHVNTYPGSEEVVALLKEEWPKLTAGIVRRVRSDNGQTQSK